jgi:predicted transcriptional regulator
MFKKIVLENSKRKKIYDFIRRNPGFHLRELQRRLKIPLSSLEHHVDYMVRHNVIYKEREGGYTRYFAEQSTEGERKLISALRNEKMREIVSIVLEKKGVKFQDLKDYLNLPASTLSYYLKYLVDYHILGRKQIGYESVYSIRDPKVRKALLIAESSFTDRLIDKVLRSFMETDFKNVNRKYVKKD